ncbi:MAG: PKD domain-containing protein [Pirellulaceae bacterium]|jgi:PKD repeat protein|nr:PKD domain-containing protein [Pirellulaceae bacterium]
MKIALCCLFAIALCASVGFAADSPRVSVEVDHAYGVPPHTVRLQASVAGQPLDLRDHKLQSWYEDKRNETTIEDDGATLHMVGNAAKMIELNYPVTVNTVVEFDFRCDRQGEIHGIGFDDDVDLDVASAQRIFVLYGSEGWAAANNQHRSYRPDVNLDRWMRFRIPVGRFYQGRFRHLVFMNDHDVDQPTADSRFRNVAIYEMDHLLGGEIRWDFGDGATATGKGIVEHVYREPGNYIAKVTVPTDAGRTTVAQTAIRVKNPPAVRRTLFIDDNSIETMSNVTRTAERALKHPANPVITGDKPWDAYRPQVYGTIMRDRARDVFRLWYLSIPSHGLSPDPEPFVGGFKRIGHTTLVGYAESKDGYRWEKPLLGIVDFNGSTKNGLVNMGRDNTEGISIVHRPDDPDPKRRYKAIFWEHKVRPRGEPTGREKLAADKRSDGMWVAFSEDGLQWKNYEKNPVIPQGSDTGQCVLFDPELKKYVLFSRLGVGRRISRCTSSDFIHWSEPQLVFAADGNDPPGTQVYGSGFCIYEGMYIGTPWMFYLGANQKIDVQLIHSRDGVTWRRTAGRERIIPNGPEGAWDSGIIFTACHPVVLDDRILILYSAFQGDHHGHPKRDWEESKKYYRGGIGVATLRRDGWVSLNLPFTGGQVVTKPVKIPAATPDDDTPRLILNANAFTGDVKVTVLDENNQPLPGFEQSNNLHGDFLRAEVTWPGGQTLAKLTGRKVKLKIHGRLAKLYSYWFE